MEQNELGLYDIYDIPYVPYDWSWVYVLVLVSVFLMVALILYYFSCKNREKLSPAQKAFKKISDLSSNRLSTSEQRKQFYFSLSSILKEFLHDQFQFDVIAMTDDELVEYLSEKKKLSQLVEDIKTITSGITFIKFAGADAAQNKMVQDLKLLEDVIVKSAYVGQENSKK